MKFKDGEYEFWTDSFGLVARLKTPVETGWTESLGLRPSTIPEIGKWLEQNPEYLAWRPSNALNEVYGMMVFVQEHGELDGQDLSTLEICCTGHFQPIQHRLPYRRCERNKRAPGQIYPYISVWGHCPTGHWCFKKVDLEDEAQVWGREPNLEDLLGEVKSIADLDEYGRYYDELLVVPTMGGAE